MLKNVNKKLLCHNSLLTNSVYALPGVGEEAFFKLVNTYWGPESHFEIWIQIKCFTALLLFIETWLFNAHIANKITLLAYDADTLGKKGSRFVEMNVTWTTFILTLIFITLNAFNIVKTMILNCANLETCNIDIINC